MLGLVDLFYAGFMIFIGVAGALTLVIGGIGLANYQLATLAERSVEIAVAKAIGARSRTLVALSVGESLAIAGASASLGVLAGLGACAALAWLAPPGEFPAPLVSGVVVAVTLAALCLVAASTALLPALRVRRMDVSAALRSG
jgi:putative ABC transport system permease protein